MNPKQVLDKRGIQPKKNLGQNFMHDPNILEKIVTTAELMPEDTVIEIGAGTGELTAHLAQAAKQVIAIEIDERLAPILEERFASQRNVYLVFEDVLKTDLSQLIGPKPFTVVANVPYYITSAILRHILEPVRKPRRAVLTMQYEVAQRITAPAGDLSLLAVSVQFYGQPRIVSKLNPAIFWPRPEVDSALVVITPFDKPPVSVPSDAEFFRVVRAGFSQKRKQLKNSLSGGLAIKDAQAVAYLTEANITPSRRAETLTLEEWAALTRVIASNQAPKGES